MLRQLMFSPLGPLQTRFRTFHRCTYKQCLDPSKLHKGTPPCENKSSHYHPIQCIDHLAIVKLLEPRAMPSSPKTFVISWNSSKDHLCCNSNSQFDRNPLKQPSSPFWFLDLRSVNVGKQWSLQMSVEFPKFPSCPYPIANNLLDRVIVAIVKSKRYDHLSQEV